MYEIIQFIFSFTENYLRYAHGIVSDYLRPELSDKLLQHLNLPPIEVASKKRKNSDLNPEEIKKLKKECAEKEINSKYFRDENKPEKEKVNLTQRYTFLSEKLHQLFFVFRIQEKMLNKLP